jgi:hypothetical protein
MTTTATQRRAAPLWVLVAAALLIGPLLVLGVVAVEEFITSQDWKPVPDLPHVGDDPALDVDGVIAYVARTGQDQRGEGGGCIFVADAGGGTPLRQLGCAGERGVPRSIGSIAWTEQGDLRVDPQPFTSPPVILPVGAGPAIAGEIPQAERTRGLHSDGTQIDVGDIDERAMIAVYPSKGLPQPIVTLDGPDRYQFNRPQWSPDGEWILFSDTEGRLLIADADGNQLRELLPADAGRQWLEPPLLTWHQGRAR